jgi:Zn finger protein HypA/HybF involved in hydrogenase expression
VQSSASAISLFDHQVEGIGNQPLDMVLGCNGKLVAHMLRSHPRPLVLQLRRSLAQSAAHEESSVISSDTQRQVLSMSIEIGQLSILALHRHQLFAFVALDEVTVACSAGEPVHHSDVDVDRSTTHCLSASSSVKCIRIMDLTPQGCKHRDVLRPPDDLSSPMLVVDVKSLNKTTCLKVRVLYRKSFE